MILKKIGPQGLICPHPGAIYEGCSLILVIDSFSPKPSSLPEENYLVVIDRFFAILKSPTDFKMIQLIKAN